MTPGAHPYHHRTQDTVDTIRASDLEAAARILWSMVRPLAAGTETRN
jgi:hypothetical protein